MGGQKGRTDETDSRSVTCAPPFACEWCQLITSGAPTKLAFWCRPLGLPRNDQPDCAVCQNSTTATTERHREELLARGLIHCTVSEIARRATTPRASDRTKASS